METAERDSKKILLYYVYAILFRYSDAAHPLPQGRIAGMVKREFGMSCDRKAVARNIRALMDGGFAISTYEDNGRGYYLQSRPFGDDEIQQLIGCVLSSRTLSGLEAQELVNKLAAQATVHLERWDGCVLSADGRKRWETANIGPTLALLNKAMVRRRRVRFFYNQYGTDRRLHPRRDTPHEVDPYRVVIGGGRFYLVGHTDQGAGVTVFCLDRITKPQLTDQELRPFEELPPERRPLELLDYVRPMPYGRDGRLVTAELLLQPEGIGCALEDFGPEVEVLGTEADGSARVRVQATDTCLRMWARQYADVAEVLAPASLRERVRLDIHKLAEKYGVFTV